MRLVGPNAPDEADARAGTSDYVRRVKIACDDLHDDPLNPAARAAMLEVLTHDLPLAW